MNAPASAIYKPARKGYPSPLWLLLLAAVAAVWVCRWVWIVRSNGDFGITYEASARVAAGEIWGRDFYITVPPLSYYSQALFYLAAHGSLWSENLHLFFWWLVAVALGLWVARKMDASPATLTAGGILALTSSAPAFNCGLAYNYVGTSLVEGALLILLHNMGRGPSWRSAASIGALMGLCVLAKHNVGILMTGFFGAAIAVLGWSVWKVSPGTWIGRLLAYSLGAGVAFGIPFLWLASHSSLANVFSILLRDGPSGRGGATIILVRTIPRVVFSDMGGTSRERMIESVVSLFLLAIVAGFAIWRLRRTSRDAATAQRTSWLPGALCSLGFLVFLSLVSAMDFPAIRDFGTHLATALGVWSVGLANLVAQLSYLITLGIALPMIVARFMALRSGQSADSSSPAPADSPTGLFLLVFCVAFAAATVTSNINYFPFAAPAIVPFFVLACHAWLGLRPSVIYLANATALCGMFLWSVYTESFCHYTPLPAASPFRGLSAGPERLREVDRLWTHVHPIIDGHTTLWLTKCGPQSAYGGKLVPNVTGLSNDTYGARVEPELFAKWNQHLPERVVRAEYATPSASTLFLPEKITQWLEAKYECVYREGALEVWSVKAEAK